MDIKQKSNILTHLAKKADIDQAAMQSIKNESAKITSILLSENQYDNIADQLELLDIIAYRVYEDAVSTIRTLLERLKSLHLTYQEIPGYTEKRQRKYQNNFTLMVKALAVLEHIRYHQYSEILDIFFEYSSHEEESVSKQAMHGIEVFSGYDLDVFYGNGKDWSGLGWDPQEKVLERIESFDDTQRQTYFSAIIIVCKEILSPTISGTSSTYKTFSWRTGAVPAKDGIKKIRKQALDELQNLYVLAEDIGQKTTIINALNTARHTPHAGEYGDEERAMIIENTITVVQFMKKIAVSDDMQIMQKIEHDAYWLLYHMGPLNETIRELALEVRDELYANEEYQKFRILIGFESIFHDWKKGEKESDDYDEERIYREQQALRFAESIDTDSYNEWKVRILRYASIKSDDLATFPYFGKFLEHFGKTSPELALQLLSEASDQLENFIIAILCGILETEHKEDVYSQIEQWCNEDKYLFSLARFFEFSSEINEKLLNKILNKSKANNDLNTLNQIISSISAQYNEKNKHLIQNFFIPALQELTAYKKTDWIFKFWFKKQLGNILAAMDANEHKAILDNLFWLHEIDYHAEEILSVIAKQSPESVIHFFCNRLSKEKGEEKEEEEEDQERYNAVPFDFHKLSEPLSQSPEHVVNAVLETYDGNYGLFIYRGARLLKNIFPNFPPEFQQKLLEVAQSREENDLLFVMAILRNYDGNPIIQNACKELVKILPDDSDLSGEITIALQSTGVVSGEYGFVEAYKQKIEEIQPWLKEENAKVREFTQLYIAELEKRIEYEQRSADEQIALRKHQYGSDED